MLKVLSCVAVFVLLAGCDRAPAPAPTAPTAPTTAIDPGQPVFAPISTVCPDQPASVPVVKIRITDVSPKKLGHVTTLHDSNSYGTAAGEKPVRTLPEVVLATENPTRLDIDAAEFLRKEGDQVLIQVELADPAATFLPGKFAVTAGNADGSAIFCVRDPIETKPGDRTARFYVRYVKSDTPRFGKYNLFLLIKDGPYTTPIVIDPKVRNHG
ncbi:hypothetical protein [uncultured Phenylobacterium sp.]|uniref:hypothetical protein n=1 Tax=uncultured Phenylobacterium sp. TaxID=349273 RepID=UPI0025E18739|nr:hypothetical protein [uncultured Phenylobacterium sp.]